MGPRMIESLIRSNGTGLSPQVTHSSGSRQPYPASSSSSSDAHRGVNKPEHSLQVATGEKIRCSSSAEYPWHESEVSSSRDAPCSYNDSDTTKSLPQINTIVRDTSSHVSKRPKLDHQKELSSFLLVDPTQSGLVGPSEPVDRSRVTADFETSDGHPIYSVSQMKIFDQKQKSIPKLYDSRWQIIRPDIFDRVHKRLSRGRFVLTLNKLKAPPIIELMSAGTTKACSMLAVVVVIPRHIETMQKFLDTDSKVRNRCRPEDGTTIELLALACKGSSRLAGMPGEPLRKDTEFPSNSDSEYVSDETESLTSTDDGDSSARLHSATRVPEFDAQSVSVVHEPSNIDENARHGMGISLITKDGSRYMRGTCGGLLELKFPDQAPRQVGLMAGHLIEQFGHSTNEQKSVTERYCFIGDILYPKRSGELPRYDWALFDAVDLHFEQRAVTQDSFAVAQESDFPDMNTVVVIRTSRGEMTGTMSFSTSGIMLNSDHGFVQVRTIMMNQGWNITKGDSGAWVLQDGYEKIYGYIIATNGNVHAYMIPLHSALAEIQTTLGAAYVSVAISTDPTTHICPAKIHDQVEEEQSVPILAEDEPIQSTIQRYFERMAKAATVRPNSGHSVITSQGQLPRETKSLETSPSEVAKMCLENGRVSEAIKILESVVKISGNVLGRNHPDCLASQHGLAVAHLQNGQTEEAIRLLKLVVAAEAEILDESNIGRLTSQHELARAFLAHGQAWEAIKILEHVVEVKSSILEKSDPHLLASKMVLAEAHLTVGRASEAVQILEAVAAAATGSSREHEKIRTHSVEWLNLACSRRDESDSERLPKLRVHQSKHKGSNSSYGFYAQKKSLGGEMLGPYIYDTRSVSEMQYRGPPMMVNQRRQEVSEHLDSFDQQFGGQDGQASYQQPYYTTTRRSHADE